MGTKIRVEQSDKRKRIYRYLYQNKVATRPEIAAALKMSLPTASQYVSDLLQNRYLEEVGIVEGTVGRNPVAIRCNPLYCAAIGVSLTLHHISAVLVDLSGNILVSKREYILFEDTDQYALKLSEIVNDLVAEAQFDQTRIFGAMVSIPGIVENSSQTICFSHVFPTGLDLKNITRYIPYSCSFCNDANAAGFSEIWDSPLTHPTAYLSINETIGGAIIMDHQIYTGVNNRSGEFGHISISRDGPLCQCGKRGCLSCYCTGNVLARHYNGSLEDFFYALQEGEVQASSDFAEYLDYLARGIDTIRLMLDCDIIIGGDVGGYFAPYISDLRAAVNKQSIFHDNSDFLHTSRHKRMSSAIGAALLLIPLCIDSIITQLG